jgi:hypothetical protein
MKITVQHNIDELADRFLTGHSRNLNTCSNIFELTFAYERYRLTMTVSRCGNGPRHFMVGTITGTLQLDIEEVDILHAV